MNIQSKKKKVKIKKAQENKGNVKVNLKKLYVDIKKCEKTHVKMIP